MGLPCRPRHATSSDLGSLNHNGSRCSNNLLDNSKPHVRGWCGQHPGSNHCVEGAYGIARFDRREPVESDEHARSTCGVRELRQPPVRRSVRSGRPPRGGRRRSLVGGERLLVANGRCWRCRESAPRRRRRAPAKTGHRAAACDQQDTRRHTATSARQRERPTRHSPPHGDIDADDICCCGRRPRRAVQLRGARQSMVLKNQQ